MQSNSRWNRQGYEPYCDEVRDSFPIHAVTLTDGAKKQKREPKLPFLDKTS
jgi:hypothetical protein